MYDGLLLVGNDISSNGINASEVLFGDTGHGDLVFFIDVGDDFDGIDGIESDFRSLEQWRGELQCTLIDTEILDDEILQILLHFVFVHDFFPFIKILFPYQIDVSINKESCDDVAIVSPLREMSKFSESRIDIFSFFCFTKRPMCREFYRMR